MNLIFVDFENVHNAGLNGLENLTENEIEYLFYSKNTPHLPMDLVGKISASPALISPIESAVGKNAMDFVIATFLGYKIKEYGDIDNYYILSKDKGYKSLVDFWQDWNVEIITDLSKFCKKTKSTATKKKVDSNNEQALRCNLGKALLEYNKKDRKLIIDTVLLGKTKTDVNNKLVKLTGNTKTAGEIFKKIKDLI